MEILFGVVRKTSQRLLGKLNISAGRLTLLHLKNDNFGRHFINSPADELLSLTVKHSSCRYVLFLWRTPLLCNRRSKNKPPLEDTMMDCIYPLFPVRPLPSTADGKDMRQKIWHKQGPLSKQYKSWPSRCLCHCDEREMGKEGEKGKRLRLGLCCPELQKLQQDAS